MSAFEISLSRRSLIAAAGASFLLPTLAACSSGASSGADSLKFWNMPWGTTEFNAADQKLVESFSGSDGATAEYQVIQWTNFTQDFASAIASNTGPAVSSGGGIQAFQYGAEGRIAYADALIEKFRADGTYDDFLPGVVDTFKTPDGYVAVPYGLDFRVLFYRQSLLEQAGAEVPTDWPSWIEAGKKLAAIGVYGFATATGPSASGGNQTLIGLMINNGGGLYNADQEPDVVTDRNIEAMDFVLEAHAAGMIDPGSVGYTNDNFYSQWKSGSFGMGFWGQALLTAVEGVDDIMVGEPLVGPHGDKGSLYFPNNVMMYTNTPSQADSEAFVDYYIKNMHTLWDDGLMPLLPVLKSIAASPAFSADANSAKIISDWQPDAKTLAAPGGTALFSKVSAADGSAALTRFGQTMFGGQTDSTSALQTLQNDLEDASA